MMWYFWWHVSIYIPTMHACVRAKWNNYYASYAPIGESYYSNHHMSSLDACSYMHMHIEHPGSNNFYHGDMTLS